MRYRFHKSFIKTYRLVNKKMQSKIDERLMVFAEESFAEILNNHSLRGNYNGYRSIDITGDYRALYKEHSQGSVIFVKLGRHAELYG
jgi:addiction module RelE/StbE family toxin